MTQCRAPSDLDVDDDEIERLRTKAAERTSKPRAAYTELLTARALARAVDPTNALPQDERATRMQLLASTLGPDGVADLVAAERKAIMSTLALMSARARRLRRIERLREAAGEATRALDDLREAAGECA